MALGILHQHSHTPNTSHHYITSIFFPLHCDFLQDVVSKSWREGHYKIMIDMFATIHFWKIECDADGQVTVAGQNPTNLTSKFPVYDNRISPKEEVFSTCTLLDLDMYNIDKMLQGRELVYTWEQGRTRRVTLPGMLKLLAFHGHEKLHSLLLLSLSARKTLCGVFFPSFSSI